ncbi:acetaldehyde dehydrogenase (acetylating) [Halioxenophilus sp. WMMB6]|uniref:acetaldehyde dehydrogenase (acetylating) n=1 Tax=Halioxenophilus sp. WMMB6 TaxID=3073815 RepID=UPI00295F127C|nr:acetaldehyde dehydrogenase (acetylating) [Halioxenophilus sp. WMMB6]
MLSHGNALNVAIIGSGKIGTDLLIKIDRSHYLNCSLVAGRNCSSEGMIKAREMGVATSDEGIDAILANADNIDIVFDATSASDHRRHAPLLAAAGIKAIDLTPAKMGPFCIPGLTGNSLAQAENINMVTCGGQATIPMLEAITSAFPAATAIHVRTLVTPDSVGPATFANIDDYKETTRNAIYAFTGVTDAVIELLVDEDPAREKMSSKMRIEMPSCDMKKLLVAMALREKLMQEYVPGYHVSMDPHFSEGVLTVEISVQGLGDWIPSHAGNLDIITCAAIEAAERYAQAMAEERPAFWDRFFSYGKGWFGSKPDWKDGVVE